MPVTSSDTNYNGADPQDIAFTNLVDDISSSSSAGGGFIITAPDNATTSEDGGTSSFTIKLNMAPTSDVSVPIYVNDSTEALITSGSYSNVDNLSLTFTSSNWSRSFVDKGQEIVLEYDKANCSWLGKGHTSTGGHVALASDKACSLGQEEGGKLCDLLRLA